MTDEIQPLADELTAARADFLAALEAVDPARLSAPDLVGEWSARELVAHLGYWAGHAAEAIHEVESGRIEQVGAGEPSVDETNETVARVARQADLATARTREAASVQALLERIATVDPALLSERLPDGATLAEGIREDGPEHYREHTDDLRSAIADR
jgi:hypothetical protein